MSRVKVYPNGDRYISIHIWGKSMEEILPPNSQKKVLA
jgi:hypothetical protein